MAGGFASWAAKPACRPAIFTGRPDRLLLYYFISIGFHFILSCIGFTDRHRRFFLHLGPQNSHVGPPFSPIGRTVNILLFYFYDFISIRFQAGGFCILGRKTCMSARHFHWSAGSFTILLFHFHWVPGTRFACKNFKLGTHWK